MKRSVKKVGTIQAATRGQDKPAIHVLVPNHAKQAPYADKTVCGIDLAENENTLSIWPGDEKDRAWLKPDKWGPKGYRWCSRCRAVKSDGSQP